MALNKPGAAAAPGTSGAGAVPPASFTYTNPQHGGSAGGVASGGGAVIAQRDPDFGIEDTNSDVVVEKKSCFRRNIWCIAMFMVVLLLGVIFVGVATQKYATGALPGGASCTADPEGGTGTPHYAEFDTCQVMFAEMKRGACGWRYTYFQGGEMVAEVAFADGGAGAPGSSSNTPASSGAGGTDYSGTNNQEEGVDEVDFVKTDGVYVYALVTDPYSYHDKYLVITDVSAPANSSVVARVNLADSHSLTGVSGLFVKDDRMLVVGSTSHSVTVGLPTRQESYYFSATTVLVFNIANRASPTLIRRVDIEGYSVSARMVRDEVFLVIGSWPHHYAYDLPASSAIAEDLLPFWSDSETVGGSSGAATRVLGARQFDPVTSCDAVGRVDIVNADTTITVVAFSLHPGGELLPLRSATVAGRGYNVYASTTSIYVASGNFNWASESTTVLAFTMIPGDYASPNPAGRLGPGVAFRGLASVNGTILNQWSMDEGPGQMLRVATHTNSWSMPLASRVPGGVSNVFIVNASDGAAANQALLASAVYAPSGAFPVVGALYGLAPGERIKAARFMGPRLYLVTFVQIDPLFVIDISDPLDPRVLGELKIPGFSEYLHPINSTHLIGIGHDAEQYMSRTVTTGVKLSLFDVGVVSDPREAFTASYGGRGTTSEALDDAKAFLWDPIRRFVIFPLRLRQDVGISSYGDLVFEGSLVVRLADTGFHVVGGVTHVPGATYPPASGFKCGCQWQDRIRRQMYIGSNLVTLSGWGLGLNSLVDDSLTEVDFVNLLG